jgi:enoyl-CoA hydratase
MILIDQSGFVLTLTLNRPEAMNALSQALRRDLTSALREAGRDDSVRAVVLTGAGTRAFSAGLDLKELSSDTSALGVDVAQDENLISAIEMLDKPIVGAVNGAAITGGFELALACDILIASPAARFADTHVRVGLLPNWGLSQKLSRIVGPSRAKELSLTGNFIDAATAERWGLVNRIVATEQLVDNAQAIAADMASADPAILRLYRSLIDDGLAMPFGEALRHEQAVSARVNGKASASALSDRRPAVQARGRQQGL